MNDTTQESIPVRSVDLTGEVCPMTFVKAKLHLDRITAGEALEIVLKDGEQLRSVAMSLKEEGHRVEQVRLDGNRAHVLVRKGT